MLIRNQFDLIIFDCDGVLVDSEPIINRVHAEILGECGYRVTPEALSERFCGMADAEMLSVIEQEWGRCLPADYEARVAALADAHCEKALVTFPGIRETLSGLDVRACVASSGTPARIRKSLGIVGLLDRFEPHLFSAVMVARGKPAPDLFLYSALNMGADPSCCVVIEDSIAGVQAAVSANMAVIGFCGGGHCPSDHGQVLRQHGAAAVISHMRDLLPSIEALSLVPTQRADPMRLELVVEELPPGFAALRTEAYAEGYRHLERLADEWVAGTMRFDGEGEALVAVHMKGELAGIGGLTIDPSQPGALRMRRFYVRTSFRRSGIGRALAKSLLGCARASGRPVTVNAAAGSELFWQSLGFVPAISKGHTHIRPTTD